MISEDGAESTSPVSAAGSGTIENAAAARPTPALVHYGFTWPHLNDGIRGATLAVASA